jgi:hypothetical protein
MLCCNKDRFRQAPKVFTTDRSTVFGQGDKPWAKSSNWTRRSILAGAAATGAIVQAASTPAQAQAVMTKATAADIAKLPARQAEAGRSPLRACA